MTQLRGTLTDETPVNRANDAATQPERWSSRVFVLAVVLAVPLLLWFGRHRWFFLDEWPVLTHDGLTSPGYLDGHNGHWITMVRVVYRMNFELWGLRSYLPYQVPVVLAHVGATVLMLLVIRRLGVRAWIATAIALAFLFFGSGRDNMAFGFQLSVTGSVVCGLALFLLTDGPRTVTRRDWLALGVAVVGLMTSSVFPALLAGVGFTTLMRRGVQVTALYAVFPAMIYAAWYFSYGNDSAGPLELTARAIRYVGQMFWAVFDALAQGGVGALLVATAALGVAAAVHAAWRTGTWNNAALPVGLGVAWLTFAGLTALARANVLNFPHSHAASRFLHVGAALLLPLVAAGVEVLAARHAILGVAALLPLAVGFPGNVERLTDTDFVGVNRQLLFAVAHSPWVDDVPPGTRLTTVVVPLTAGWLSRQAQTGRIPEPVDTDGPLNLTATAELVLAQHDGSVGRSDCPELVAPLPTTLQPGSHLEFTGAIDVAVTDGAEESRSRRFLSLGASVVEALAGPVDVLVRPVDDQLALVCGPG